MAQSATHECIDLLAPGRTDEGDHELTLPIQPMLHSHRSSSWTPITSACSFITETVNQATARRTSAEPPRQSPRDSLQRDFSDVYIQREERASLSVCKDAINAQFDAENTKEITTALRRHQLLCQTQRLAMLMLWSLIAAIFSLVAELAMYRASSYHLELTVSVCYCLWSLTCLACLLTWKERVLRATRFAVTLTMPVALWVLILGSSSAVEHTGSELRITDANGIQFMFLVILLLHVYVWSHDDKSSLFGSCVSLVHIAIVCFARKNYPHILEHSSGGFLLLAASNILGAYHCYLDRQRHRLLIERLKAAISRRTLVENERERQESLLLSIIPPYLAEQVRRQLMQRASKTQSGVDSTSTPMRFHDLHVQVHDNVSILFADIVNFTPLTARLTAPQLVRTLNALFARFDQLSQEHQCMRIKILGDCYYCVSGMPVNRPNHADNCVRMGFDMIDAIRTIREATSVDVDMRIGVHTGSVLCGILGLRKWQYDIWSDDVTIANAMESSGRAGCIHVTQTTLQALSDTYDVQSATPSKRKSKDVISDYETYFILPPLPKETEDSQDDRRASVTFQLSVAETTTTTLRAPASPLHAAASPHHKMSEFWGVETPFANLKERRRSSRTIRAASIALIRNHIDEADLFNLRKPFLWLAGLPRRLQEEWRSCTNRKRGMRVRGAESDKKRQVTKCPSTLTDSPQQQHNDLALFGTLGFTFLLECTALVITVNRQPGMFIFASTGVLVILLPLAFAFLLTRGFCVQNSNDNLQTFSTWLTPKLFMFILPAVCITELCLVPLVGLQLCSNSTDLHGNMTQIDTTWNFCSSSEYITVAVQIILFTISLVKIGSVFFRVSIISLAYIGYCSIIEATRWREIQFAADVTTEANTGPDLWFITSSWISLFLTTAVIVTLEVQAASLRRIDTACLSAFREEQEDVETMQDINTILLHNILPAHVAHYFLDSHGDSGVLYHESHDHVCVIFASIPNFQEFWNEQTEKLECLRLLNEIICEIDKLLSKPKFCHIEKIKTVGSTYMAAAGLHPSTAIHDHARLVGIMVEFVLAMMNILEQINQDSFQSFQFRVGLSYGHVLAGVIGASKPQYDIWGNTVNMASRMDTHGEMGKLHATAEAANALLSCSANCDIESRGLIKVKGVAEPIETFYVIPS